MDKPKPDDGLKSTAVWRGSTSKSGDPLVMDNFGCPQLSIGCRLRQDDLVIAGGDLPEALLWVNQNFESALTRGLPQSLVWQS